MLIKRAKSNRCLSKEITFLIKIITNYIIIIIRDRFSVHIKVNYYSLFLSKVQLGPKLQWNKGEKYPKSALLQTYLNIRRE